MIRDASKKGSLGLLLLLVNHQIHLNNTLSNCNEKVFSDGKLMKDIEDEEVQNVLNGYRVQPPEAHSEINSELPSSSSNRDSDQAPHFSAFSYRLPTMSAGNSS